MDTACPYCDRPEGWDACPVHRDGTPPAPTEERRPDPRTTERRQQ